jgi:cell division transport system ATP-binding protein
MISFQKVTKIYDSSLGPITALADVSFEVKPKEFVSIVGRSGAGKTTIFRLLLAEEKPTEGIISFDGQPINEISSSKLPFFRRRIGAVFQDYKLLSSKTTYENVAFVMELMGCEDEDIRRDVPEVLDLVGLAERASNFPEELSGGERQRVAIARALIHRPEIILVDEPTGNLDPFNTQSIIQLFSKINEMGTTVILATHNKDIINRLEKRVITLEEGKIIRDDENSRFAL